MTTRPATRLVPIAAALLLAAAPALAADHVVNMLNSGKDGTMVFEPAYVKAAVGDTVIFKPMQVGAHYAASLLVPSGAKAFKGEVDKEYRYKIDKEGVYVYICEPHRILGMAGVIQAGKPVNLAAAQEAAKKEQATWAMSKDRLDKALAQVK